MTGSDDTQEPVAWQPVVPRDDAPSVEFIPKTDRDKAEKFLETIEESGAYLRPLYTDGQLAEREIDILEFVIGRLREDGINISEGGEEKLMREIDEEFGSYGRLPDPGEQGEAEG